MAKIVILAYVDITISDEIEENPPHRPIADLDSEVEAIISDGSVAEGFSYVRLLGIVGDVFSTDVYELTED